MVKLIGLILFVLMLLVGIVVLALGAGIGLLLLIVGLMGTVAMAIIVGSTGGTISHFLTPRGFFDPFLKTKVEKKNENANIWDEMSQKRDEK